METKKWIDPRKEPPANGQNVYFITTNNKQVHIGFFQKNKRPEEFSFAGDMLGTFVTGIVYDKDSFDIDNELGQASGIGFHVWVKNNREVTHWMPIELPKAPKNL
jgi:hypothetical protein